MILWDFSKLSPVLFLLVFVTACYKTGSPNSNTNSYADATAKTVVENPPLSAPLPPAPPSLLPVAPVLDANCLSDSQGNICLFQKSPVADKNAALADTSLGSSEITPLQVYSATLSGTSGNLLQNDHVKVLSYDQSQAAPVNGLWKFAYSAEKAKKLAQAITFFWFNQAKQICEVNTGIFWAKGKQIRVVTDDAFSGWTSASNTIHLEHRNGQMPFALDPSILLYFMGIANAHYASLGAVLDYSLDTSHAACALVGSPPKRRDCCASANGCSRAMLSGMGEYFQAMIFPNSPVIGETVANSPAGLSKCQSPRDLRTQANTTAAQAYDACSASGGASGQIYPLGTLYASIWWELRRRAQAQSATGAKDMDTLFMQHMAQLRGEDNFISIQAKILFLDSQNFQSRYYFMVRDEFSRRGIPLR